MARPKLATIDIARSMYWFDLTFSLLKTIRNIDTIEGFSNFFHQDLELDGDSNIFWKIKQGRTTLGEKWVERIEKKEGITLRFYDNFFWQILKKNPQHEGETLQILSTVPQSIKQYLFEYNDDEGREQIKELKADDLISIKNLHTFDSLGVLFLLHIYARQIYSLDLINDTAELIYQSLEEVSQQKGLERVHILLFDLLETRVFIVELQGYNRPRYIKFPWRSLRDNTWSNKNRIDSYNNEKKLEKDKVLDTKLVKPNTELEELNRQLQEEARKLK